MDNIVMECTGHREIYIYYSRKEQFPSHLSASAIFLRHGHYRLSVFFFY